MKLYGSCTPEANRASAEVAEARESWRTRDDSNIRPLPSEDIGREADRASNPDTSREQGENIGTNLYGSCTELSATDLQQLHSMLAPVPMTFERAEAINSAICDRAFAAMGMLERDAGSLEGVSLRDMMTAVAMVGLMNNRPSENGARTIHVVPDPRLIAAAFALENYRPDCVAVVYSPGKGVGHGKGLMILMGGGK